VCANSPDKPPFFRREQGIGFEDIREAHRVMEANEANGKMVVKL
jgi:hypothetical protein